MVRALSIYPWGLTHSLSRLRPGIAISVAFHAVLLLCLAYALSFQPRAAEPDIEKDTIRMVQPPVIQPPPPKPVERSTFHVMEIRPLIDVPITVATLPLPPDPTPHRPATVTDPPVQDTPPLIINPHPLSRGGLVYPERAVEMGKSGYVDFTFVIEPDGSVGGAQVIDEVPEGYGFATAARKAFSTWKFEPKTVGGRPVAAAAQIRISFQLH
jgi:TonB family protein